MAWRKELVCWVKLFLASWIADGVLALGPHLDTSFSRRECLESPHEQLLCTFRDRYHLIFWWRGCEDTLARVKGYCVPGVCVGTLQEVVSHFGTQMKVACECLKGHSGTGKSSPEQCQKFTCLLLLLLYSQRSTITELDDFPKLKNQKVISLATSCDIQKTHLYPAIGSCTPCSDSRHWWWVGLIQNFQKMIGFASNFSCRVYQHETKTKNTPGYSPEYSACAASQYPIFNLRLSFGQWSLLCSQGSRGLYAWDQGAKYRGCRQVLNPLIDTWDPLKVSTAKFWGSLENLQLAIAIVTMSCEGKLVLCRSKRYCEWKSIVAREHLCIRTRRSLSALLHRLQSLWNWLLRLWRQGWGWWRLLPLIGHFGFYHWRSDTDGCLPERTVRALVGESCRFFPPGTNSWRRLSVDVNI